MFLSGANRHNLRQNFLFKFKAFGFPIHYSTVHLNMVFSLMLYCRSMECPFHTWEIQFPSTCLLLSYFYLYEYICSVCKVFGTVLLPPVK